MARSPWKNSIDGTFINSNILKIITNVSKFRDWLKSYHQVENDDDFFQGYKFFISTIFKCLLGSIDLDSGIKINEDYVYYRANFYGVPIDVLPNTCDKTILVKNIWCFNENIQYSSNWNDIEVAYRASKGREAVAKNKENPADIIIMSEPVWSRDGEIAVGVIQNNYPKTKFIYIPLDDLDAEFDVPETSQYRFSIPSELRDILDEISLPTDKKVEDTSTGKETEPDVEGESVDYKEKYERLVQALKRHFGDTIIDEIIEYEKRYG